MHRSASETMISIYMTTALTSLLLTVALAIEYECPVDPSLTIGDTHESWITNEYNRFLNILTCENGNITFQFEPTTLTEVYQPILINLWYDCTTADGNSTVGIVYTNEEFSSVILVGNINLSSLNPTDCTFFGLFYNEVLSAVRCFEISNSSSNCSSAVLTTLGPIPTASSSGVYTTTVTTMLPTRTSSAGDLSTTGELSMTATSASTLGPSPTAGTSMSPITTHTTTGRGGQQTIRGESSMTATLTSTLGPSPTPGTSMPPIASPMTTTGLGGQQTIRDHHWLMAIIIILCIAVLSILVLIAILLKLRQVQRRKSNWQRTYYKKSEAKEPFDPDFAPTDFKFSAQLNKFLSLLSVFDPYEPQPKGSDDDMSEVLQGTNLTHVDSSSIESSILKDDSEVALDIPLDETDVLVENSRNKEPSEKLNGSVSTDSTALRKKQFSPVSNEYVVTLDSRPYSSSAVALQSGGGSAQFRDNTSPPRLNSMPSEQMQLHTQQSETGYVNSPNLMKGKPLSQNMYTTLNNGYTILLSQQYPTKKVPCEQDLDPVYCNEDLEDDSGDRLYFERVAEECNFVLNEASPEPIVTPTITAECSLSINPLHFEPVNYDELMQGHTSPSYVNTQAS